MGNATRCIPEQYSDRVIKLPRKDSSVLPVWQSGVDKQDIDDLKAKTSQLLNNLVSRNRHREKNILFYDGHGPTVDGDISQLFMPWFLSRPTKYVFLEHGDFLPDMKSLVRSFIRRVYKSLFGADHKFAKINYEDYLVFVSGWRNGIRAFVHGSKLSRIRRVGNLNLLAINNTRIVKAKNNQVSITRVVLFSAGSYRRSNLLEQNEFENLMYSIQKALPNEAILALKFKSGEVPLMGHEQKKYLSENNIEILSDDFSISDTRETDLVVANSSSNVCIEALMHGNPLMVYHLDGVRRNNISKFVKRSGIPVYKVGGKLRTKAIEKVVLNPVLSLDKNKFLSNLEVFFDDFDDL